MDGWMDMCCVCIQNTFGAVYSPSMKILARQQIFFGPLGLLS
jgi:hypothetical protein